MYAFFDQEKELYIYFSTKCNKTVSVLSLEYTFITVQKAIGALMMSMRNGGRMKARSALRPT
jgi:hypothetical protein